VESGIASAAMAASGGDAKAAASQDAMTSAAATDTAGMSPAGPVAPLPLPPATGDVPRSDASAAAASSAPMHDASEQVAIGLKQAAHNGVDQIQIHLKPEALGAIDVRLEVAADGRVHAAVTADRPETLALLHNDARGLEQALRDAGLRADGGSLSFNLRNEQGGFAQQQQQQRQFGQQAGEGHPSPQFARAAGDDDDSGNGSVTDIAGAATGLRSRSGSLRPGALDLRV
jgi:flagellar hook-length control protein FliK